MTVLEVRAYFRNEISGLYSESESAELFLIFAEKILGLHKFELRKSYDNELNISQQTEFYQVIPELKSGKPYQLILGEAAFFGMRFFVTEHVLIPRPETEELLELAIQKISNLKSQISNLRILDIGTGSGIIPIILKKHFPEAEISSIDISDKAIETAKKNAEFHQTDINFIHADYLNFDLNGTFDIIISNPPYIGKDEETEIADSVKEFEPKNALFPLDADPLVFYRKISEDAKNCLSDGGMVFLEINQKLGPETLAIFKDFHISKLIKDISGNDRFVFVQN